MPRTPNRDRGQAFALILITIVIVAIAAVAVATVGRRMVQRSRAQVAADAAALAGTTDGAPGAARVAAANGGHVMSISITSEAAGTRVDVVVEVGGETARAAASTAP